MSENARMALVVALYVVGALLTAAAFAATPRVLHARYGDGDLFIIWLRRRTLGGMLGLALMLVGSAVWVATA